MTVAEAVGIIDSRGSDPLCGIWTVGGDGARLAFLPRGASATEFDVFILDSPDLSVVPGQQIGTAVSTGRAATYDTTLRTLSGLPGRSRHLIIELLSDGTMTFRHYKKGKKITLWRWLPYLFRISVSDNDSRPSSADGAVKTYPTDTASPYPTLL